MWSGVRDWALLAQTVTMSLDTIVFDAGLLFLAKCYSMPARAPIRGKPLILHIEDNKTQSDVLKIILETNGFSLLSADTAEEALEICREVPVSLVLADHMLGGIAGTELAGRIKALKPNLPVVLHSGMQPTNMLHLDGFIHKGESVRDLVAFLRRLIDRFWE